MGGSPPDVDDLGLDELRKLVVELLERSAALKAENAALREEIARLKGLKGRPKLKPSGMETASEPRPERRAKRRKGKRAKLVIHEERVITAEAPAGARFKGYEDFVVQELVIRPRVIRFRRERWLTRDGQTLVAALPAWVEGHFGPALKRYVLAQYHQGQVTVPRLVAQLNDLGLRISKRHVVRLLTMGKEGFHDEAIGVLRAGLETARWVTVDDTGARHKAVNGVTTQIGNETFTWFATTRSKSRLNFLELLRAGHTDYVINTQALAYMRAHNLSHTLIGLLAGHQSKRFADESLWRAHIERLGMSKLKVNPDPVKIATEGALMGSVVGHGFLRHAVIVSDDAGQFNVGHHALCWVHGPSGSSTSWSASTSPSARPSSGSGRGCGGSTPTSRPIAATRPRAPRRRSRRASIVSSPPAPVSPPSTACSRACTPTRTNSWSCSTVPRCPCIPMARRTTSAAR